MDWHAFTKIYRRLKLSIPIRWVDRGDGPGFVIDDPEIEKALELHRHRKAKHLRFPLPSRKAS